MAGIVAPLIRFDGVCKSFKDSQALSDISFQLMEGERFCLLGHSGAGKTTLLQIAAGLIDADAGSVWLEGREASAIPPHKRKIGFIFQDYALFPHLTAIENICFGLNGMPRDKAHSIAEALLERVYLQAKAQSYPSSLSGGQKQRLALARTLAPAPGLILMDEPFSGLDAPLRHEMRSFTLELLQQSNIACLMVTHDPEDALAITEHVGVIEQGRLTAFGKAKEMLSASPIARTG
ncbi:MAG: ABC transporter ATP-binding protein [Parvibaculales bacterium]